MKNCVHVISLCLCLMSVSVFAYKNNNTKAATAIFADDAIKPRMRVIIDNDIGGDDDGVLRPNYSLMTGFYWHRLDQQITFRLWI